MAETYQVFAAYELELVATLLVLISLALLTELGVEINKAPPGEPRSLSFVHEIAVPNKFIILSAGMVKSISRY